MNKIQINIFLIVAFFALLKADVPDYSDLVKSSRKKATSVSELYQKVIADYRIAALNHNQLKNNTNSPLVDPRLEPFSPDEHLFVGISKIVNAAFENLDQEEVGAVFLESPEEKDIEASLTEKTYKELGLVAESGKGLISNLSMQTGAGKAVALRYLIDSHLKKEDIEAKQDLQRRMLKDPVFRSSLLGHISAIASRRIEKKILNAFILCKQDKAVDQADILGLVGQIGDYTEIISAIGALVSKDKGSNGSKILFTHHLNIESNKIFQKFKELVAAYEEEKKNWQLSHPKAKALENFLRRGDLFTEVLFPAMAAYGACDLFLATTQLMSPANLGNRHLHLDFAKVVENAVPYVKAENIANPNFQNPIAVSFDFKATETLGGVVITGGNGSGKSFGFRQLLVNIILAQAYGLARGNLEFTPFSIIDMHANISDQQSGLSKFDTELSVLDKTVESIKLMPKNKKALCFFDETFSSTDSTSGFQLLSVAAQFLKHPNVMTMFITHFEQVVPHTPELEPWRTKVTKNIDGTYTNLYTLERGVSEARNALINAFKKFGPVFQKMHKDRFGNSVIEDITKKQPQTVNQEAAKAA